MKWKEKLETGPAHRHDVLMEEASQEPMDASKQFCPNTMCSARGQIGQGNIRVSAGLILTIFGGISPLPGLNGWASLAHFRSSIKVAALSLDTASEARSGKMMSH